MIVPVYNERYLAEESLRRLLAVQSPVISRLEVLIVDDCSTDGSRELVEKIAASDPRIRMFYHAKNQGKGAAIRTGLEHATGDITIIHDADLEYHPEDIPALIEVFLKEGADAVFGSRYLASRYHRALMYRHSLINKIITAIINLLTDVDLTDVETCYKAIKTDLFKSIPIRSRDFRFEVEIAMKLANRGAHIYEVPIRYLPRTYAEGKKIRFRDGLLALQAALRFFFIQDLFHRDRHGLHLLLDIRNAPEYNRWTAELLRAYVAGDQVMELSAGIGNLTKFFIPRQRYVAAEKDPHALSFLRSYALGKPYLSTPALDPENPAAFGEFRESMDTVIAANVLEFVKDDRAVLRGIHGALRPGGRVVAFVPHDPALFGSIERASGFRERYTKAAMSRALEDAGFQVAEVLEVNRIAWPFWRWASLRQGQKRLSLIQNKLLELLTPAFKHIDGFLPWNGISLIAVGIKKGKTA